MLLLCVVESISFQVFYYTEGCFFPVMEVGIFNYKDNGRHTGPYITEKFYGGSTSAGASQGDAKVSTASEASGKIFAVPCPLLN